MIRIIDNFLSPEVRTHALASTFTDEIMQDGEVYKRICITEVPGLREAIEREMGPVDMLGMGYRLNFDGETPNAAIHSDVGWGTHAAVVYLSEGHGGTAFWRHKATGKRKFRPGDVEFFETIRHEWDDVEKWEFRFIADLKLCRGVIYESSLFHSRWPFEAFGTCPEDGRLIAVAFFTPRHQ